MINKFLFSFGLKATEELSAGCVVALYDGEWVIAGTPRFSDTILAPSAKVAKSDAPFWVDSQHNGGFGRFISGCAEGETANVACEPILVEGVFTHVMYTTRVVYGGNRLKWNYGSDRMASEFQRLPSPSKQQPSQARSSAGAAAVVGDGGGGGGCDDGGAGAGAVSGAATGK